MSFLSSKHYLSFFKYLLNIEYLFFLYSYLYLLRLHYILLYFYILDILVWYSYLDMCALISWRSLCIQYNSISISGYFPWYIPLYSFPTCLRTIDLKEYRDLKDLDEILPIDLDRTLLSDII